MLKEVLKSREILNEFYAKVWEAICTEFPKHAEEVKFGPIYKTTPINATLELPIVVEDEVLRVHLAFSKEKEDLGRINKIEVEEFGEIPSSEKAYFPMKF